MEIRGDWVFGYWVLLLASGRYCRARIVDARKWREREIINGYLSMVNGQFDPSDQRSAASVMRSAAKKLKREDVKREGRVTSHRLRGD